MPEYLAPAVYLEEVDTGSKPIEGVSTSTAGVVGVTERGPVNVPTLVTSYGEFQRIFGQTLNAVLYGQHRFLPHAVEGFFSNGGKRLYVTRVLDIQLALASHRSLVAPDVAMPLASRLLLAAAPASNTITLVSDPGLVVNDTVQIGDGVNAEFMQIAVAAAAAQTVTLRLPLSFDHGPTDSVDHATITGDVPVADHQTQLAQAALSGATTIMLDLPTLALLNPPIATGDVFSVGNGDAAELVVAAGPPVVNRLDLRAPLMLSHPLAANVRRQSVVLTPPAPTTQIPAGVTATPGTVVVPVAANAGLTTAGDAIRFDHGNSARVEFRRIGALTEVTLNQLAYADYPAGSLIERVTPGAASGAVGLTADADVGALVISVSDRTGMAVGELLEVGLGVDLEVVEIAALPAVLPPPNAGNVVLRAPLRVRHPQAAGVVVPRAAVTAADRQTVLVLAASVADNTLLISRAGYAAGDLVRVTTAAGGPYFHRVLGAPVAVAPQTFALTNPLTHPHALGSAVARRSPIITVRALDAGSWGNRLRVGMETQDMPLLSTHVRSVLPGDRLRLDSAAGVETGTELLITDSTNTTTAVKVQSIDPQDDFLIVLEPATPLPGIVGSGDAVTTREYRLVVELLRQPDPANPARNNLAIDREVFAGLSLDPRHSRYFEQVIGSTWNMAVNTTTHDDIGQPLRQADRRSRGESNYIRVRDLAPGTGLRTGPVATYAPTPGGRRRLVLLPLANGVNGFPINDLTYVGSDNVDPDLRTGLETLRNVEEISIVAAPGRTSPIMQTALINHCELMRYRFVVLDGQPPPTDSIPAIQAQRQQFDTKYAALYHPWVLIPDPYPVSPATPPDYPIPPSGHMLGIFARTDIERGVHKAPANEVVRGVIGLQRLLNKEQHDILNPYPVNINVIRDFRTNNRGIRVFGGRCITSDSDWKYVNVRRLLIFIEASIDRGLQWVVFEPNSEPLWARVRRSISNFLTLAWRNGALEGTQPEEAFFVKCDRTTMTQTDIDQGRLICQVGVAPVKPAEFVIVRIGLWTAHADD